MKIENNILCGTPITAPNVSLGQYLYDNLWTNGNHILQIDAETGKHYTYKDVLRKSIALATALRNYGINIEDRISVSSENHPNYVISMCSTLFVGATFAPLNPTYTEREYRHMLELLQPRIMFVSKRTESIISKIAPTLSWTMKLIQLDDKAAHRDVITLSEILEKHTNIEDPYTFVPVEIGDNGKRMAAILCSSGTTGFPKGVMLSHRNLLIFIQSSRNPSLMNTKLGDRILLFLPMFHGYAFGLMNLTICSGATMVTMRRFDLKIFLGSVEKYRITFLPLVPPILIMLAKHPTVLNYDFSSVTDIMSGAAPLPKDVADEVSRRTNVKRIRNGYGMTELTIVSNISDRESEDNTVGPVMPGFRCKVVDTETGKTVGPKEIGEICFTGDQIMLGYFKNQKITAETIDKENWLHTGDLGYFNEQGSLYITGRIKELIKYKGFQVSPSEIEAIILTHPSVKDVAVIGKPDEFCGEIPVALVVKQSGKNILEKEIIEFVKENMSPQKWLRGGVKFVESIPKTPSGKILRRDLHNVVSKL